MLYFCSNKIQSTLLHKTMLSDLITQNSSARNGVHILQATAVLIYLMDNVNCFTGLVLFNFTAHELYYIPK